MKEEYIFGYAESASQVSLCIKKPSLKYLDEFLHLKCASDLLPCKLFPNAKEITESMAAYNAVRRNLYKVFPFGDEEVFCIVIGDGHVPRTGALFACRTKWNVISIDPCMYKSKIEIGQVIQNPHGIQRLTAIRSRIEDVEGLPPAKGKVLIVCVHSHAKLTECLKPFEKKVQKYLVNIPCCVEPDLKHEPDVRYVDWGIHSKKRFVEIYKKVK
jgi:hypothetical protein